MKTIVFEEMAGYPQEEGQFLLVNKAFHFPLDMQIVYVYWRKPVTMAGISFDGYWAHGAEQPIIAMKGTWYRMKTLPEQ